MASEAEGGERIRAIFFDIDDTLYSSTDLSQKARRTAIEHMVSKGLEMDPEEAYEALLRVVKRYGSNYGYHLDRFFTDELKCPPDYRMISAAVIAYHHTKFVNMRPYPHTVETVLELRLMGTKLGIITDGLPIKQWEKLVRLGLDDFFEAVIISGDENVGLNKPDPKVFELALDKIGVSADEAAMVGDKIHTDIDGANRIGMTSIWLRTPRDPADLPEQMDIHPDFTIADIRQVLDVIGLLNAKSDT
jgi:putative hydrolase of the HAD superfamily